MKELPLGDRVLCLISENNTHDWPVADCDRGIPHRKPFLTYIGGTKAELAKIRKTLSSDLVEVRKARRVSGHPYELKCYGLGWDEARNLPIALAATDRERQENRQSREAWAEVEN